MLAAVAGGGLAGAAFGIEIVRGGGRAVLVEKTAGPHHKVCGEFLSDDAQVLLSYLGADCVRLGSRPIAKLMLADRSLDAAAPLPFLATGLSRFRLDEALLSEARQAGVDVRRSTTVDSIEAATDGIRFNTSKGSIVADVGVLASGKHNIRGYARPGGSMVGFKMHVWPAAVAGAMIESAVQLYAFPGGYGGVCIVENGVMSVAWNMRTDVLRHTGGTWEAQQNYLTRHSERFANLTDAAQPVWEKLLAVFGQPFGFLRSDPLPAALYPVGDQLAVVPSFIGDGTALALASGIAAARAALNGETSFAFQKRINSRHRTQFRLARALDFMMARGPLRAAGLYAARAMPSMITQLVAATRLRGFEDILATARAEA